MRRVILLIALLTAWAGSRATDYSTLQVKAERFYKYDEWASALAMYTLMLEQQPQEVDSYAHAIMSATLLNDTARVALIVRQALNAHVPLDPLYDNVQRLAFEQGNACLYERFLETLTLTYPWMRRNIDARLLDYYTWRRDGWGMIEYARHMLDGMPENIKFLTALADGYFTVGEDTNGVDTYNKILAIDPDNYHALLVLGNYYYNLKESDRFNQEAPILAHQYLSRAYSIHPTPYVKKLLEPVS